MSDAEALGSDLREAREGRDLTLEQAEKGTRIRARYLEALEQGNYSALPSAVQTRGFLRNYARYLGLDADLMVSRYDAALQGGRRRGRRVEPIPEAPPPVPRRTQPPQTPVPPREGIPTIAEEHERRKRRSWLGTLAILVVALILFVGLLIVGSQGLQSLFAPSSAGGVILSPLPRDVSPTPNVTNTPDPTATPIRPTPLPNPNIIASPTGSGNVLVQLQIRERTWLRVIVDGQVSFMGSAAPDTVHQYRGNSVNVRVANAVGVRAVVNGQDMGVLGARGQIVDQTYTAGGTIQASPTAPPKPASNSPNTTGGPIGELVSTSPQATFSLTPTVTPTRKLVTLTPLPTFPPTATWTLTPTSTATPTITPTPTITYTPSVTRTPTNTPTPSNTPRPTLTYTPSMTFTPSNTPFFLPNETSTPEGGEIRPK